MKWPRLVFGVISFLLLANPAQAQGKRWLRAWSAPPIAIASDPAQRSASLPRNAATPPTVLATENSTLRTIVTLAHEGRRVRLRLGNEFGTTPVIIGAIQLARASHPEGVGDLSARDARPVTVGGATSFELAAGAPVLTDPVRIDVTAGETLVISVYLPGLAALPERRMRALLLPGDQSGVQHWSQAQLVNAGLFLTGLDVEADRGETLIAIGDSITDGNDSAKSTWPIHRLVRTDGRDAAFTASDARPIRCEHGDWRQSPAA